MKIQPIKRLASLALGAVLCLAQAGCSFSGLDAQNLMFPPRASLDQQGIYELLQGDQQELTLVYPKRGDHRSAIIMHDWSGDGVEDAVGFVALDRGVEVHFLEKSQGDWRAAASFGNTATQVDLVCFGDLNGDGVEDVIIGWGSTTGTTGRTASVSAYLYQEGNVTEYSLGTYGELALTDFDENGIYEVFTVDMYIAAEEEGAVDLPATAHVYAWQEDTLREVHTASADNSITFTLRLPLRPSDSLRGEGFKKGRAVARTPLTVSSLTYFFFFPDLSASFFFPPSFVLMTYQREPVIHTEE